MIIGDDEEPRVYSVRLTDASRREIEQEHDRLAGISGPHIAVDWQQNLLAAVRGLATYPERCVIASENTLFQQASPGDTLRQFVYRRTRTCPSWRILFSVHEADENDSPIVRVHHILHGAQAPMTEWLTEDETSD